MVNGQKMSKRSNKCGTPHPLVSEAAISSKMGGEGLLPHENRQLGGGGFTIRTH